MNTPNIRIDGQLADYENLGALPFSLSVQTDSILSLVGSDGISVDNVAKSLSIPATKRNLAICKNPHEPTSEEAKQSFTISVSLSGNMIFEGKCFVKGVTRSGGRPSKIALGLLGGTAAFFSVLNSLKLPQLDMGQIDYTEASIEASWAGSYDTGHKGVFAPVVYRGLDQADGVNTYLYDHYRLHVYYPAIFDAIAVASEVTFESQLFQTEYFKRHVYLFGVGSAWKTGNSSDGYFRAEHTASANVIGTSAWTPLSLPDETTSPNSDIGNNWDGSIYTAPIDNPYSFSGYISTGSNIEVRLVSSTGFSQTLTLGQSFQVDLLLEAGDTIGIQVQKIDLNNIISFLSTGSHMSGRGYSTPVLGGTIDIASCLHNNPVKDFIRGVSHQFNMAWAYDPSTKTVYCDPRFDFELDGTIYPGFYHSPASTDPSKIPLDWSSKVDNETQDIIYFTEFGQELILKNKEEDSEIGVRCRANSPASPLGSVTLQINESGLEGLDGTNPYWEDLHMLTGHQSLDGMPVVVPDYDPEKGLPTEDPSFESNPKYAYYAGNILYSFWSDDGTLTATRPVLYQRPQENLLYDPQGNASYNDFSSNGYFYKGYVSIFYPTLLEIIKNGRYLKSDLNVSNDDMSAFPLGFRVLKKVKVGGNAFLCLNLDFKGYKPIDIDSTKPEGRLLFYVPHTKATLDGLIQNNASLAINVPLVPSV